MGFQTQVTLFSLCFFITLSPSTRVVHTMYHVVSTIILYWKWLNKLWVPNQLYTIKNSSINDEAQNNMNDLINVDVWWCCWASWANMMHWSCCCSILACTDWCQRASSGPSGSHYCQDTAERATSSGGEMWDDQHLRILLQEQVWVYISALILNFCFAILL